MYGALWRLLPGPVWLRVLLVVLMVAIVLALCVYVVFPWLNTFVNTTEVTVDG